MAEGDARRGETVSRWVCFELNGQHYGVPILEVQEVLASCEIEPLPGTPPEVLGVINLRGAIVSVVDLRTKLGLSPRPDDAHTRVIVMTHQGEAIGLRVDRVTQVRALIDTLIRPAPTTGAQDHTPPVKSIWNRNHELLSLLDSAALLS